MNFKNAVARLFAVVVLPSSLPAGVSGVLGKKPGVKVSAARSERSHAGHDTWLWHQLPVIRRRCWYLFVSLNPINDQFPNLLAGSRYDGRVLIHVVTTATIDTVVIGRQPQLLRWR